ncbi:MAG: phytanoyl-CoA dioxygenase family protein [Rhizomicrobium sp.]
MAIGSVEEALAQAGVTAATLSPADARALDDDGYVVLRGAIPAECLDDLRARFEAAVLAPDRWPAPREHGTRHAMLENDAAVRRVCLSPPLLAAAFHVLKERFFFKGVQGRDPSPGGGYQLLHRDWPDDGAVPGIVVGLGFLDPFGAANGATRLVPGTHFEAGEMNDYSRHVMHPREIVAEGDPGDVLIFHGRLVHSGLRNESGAPRRTLQVCWQCHSSIATVRETRDLSAASPLDRYWMGAD